MTRYYQNTRYKSRKLKVSALAETMIDNNDTNSPFSRQ